MRNSEEDFERGKEVGADGYFTKPFDPFKLGEDILKNIIVQIKNQQPRMNTD
ncbi:hypothetical protein KAR34_11705 [bacterium]|nr:hypothetical protein [bacterium]